MCWESLKAWCNKTSVMPDAPPAAVPPLHRNMTAINRQLARDIRSMRDDEAAGEAHVNAAIRAVVATTIMDKK